MNGDSGCLANLQAIVLLDGSVRPNPFTMAIGRSLLDLPIDSKTKLLEFWQTQAEEFAKDAGVERLPMRVVIDQSAQPPEIPPTVDRVFLDVERDPVAFRGTGGLLRDVAQDYHDDDFLLVVTGTQLLQEDLTHVVQRLARADADVTVVSHRDGTPAGVFLLRCGALRDLSAIGFVDLKEQALPQIGARWNVRVVDWDTPMGLPIRTPTAYLDALRAFHRRKETVGAPRIAPAFEESWRPTFAIIEPGAEVDPVAELLDSVALAGCQVQAGAAAVRSVICPGAVIPAGQTVRSELIQAPS